MNGMDDNIFKIALAAFTGFISWIMYGVKQNNRKHEKNITSVCELQRKSAVVEEQMHHILDKLDHMVQLCNDLKTTNTTILKALARKAK